MTKKFTHNEFFSWSDVHTLRYLLFTRTYFCDFGVHLQTKLQYTIDTRPIHWTNKSCLKLDCLSQCNGSVELPPVL